MRTVSDKSKTVVFCKIKTRTFVYQNSVNHEVKPRFSGVFRYIRQAINFSLLSSADKICRQFGSRSEPENVGPDLAGNCLSLSKCS